MESVKRERNHRNNHVERQFYMFETRLGPHGCCTVFRIACVCLSATNVPILGHIGPISHSKAQAERRGGSEFGGRWVSGNDFTGTCCYTGSSGSSQNAQRQQSWWDRRQECWSSTRAYTHLLYSATQTHTAPSSAVGLIMGSWRKSQKHILQASAALASPQPSHQRVFSALGVTFPPLKERCWLGASMGRMHLWLNGTCSHWIPSANPFRTSVNEASCPRLLFYGGLLLTSLLCILCRGGSPHLAIPGTGPLAWIRTERKSQERSKWNTIKWDGESAVSRYSSPNNPCVCSEASQLEDGGGGTQ